MKKFFVVFVSFSLIALAILSKKIFAIPFGQFILYTIPPLILGLLVLSSIFEKKQGILAFSIVAAALFVYLLLIDKNMTHKFYIISAVASGLGAMIYLFQVKE
ncbi:MAG: hypothetical protein KAR07_08565 [Spirochaetes bacterium]|nr:hypothetical protein [Spirochaetota bacterium]MCK5268206.1 hypothetical protein [Spirochaetota bacterium]